MNSRREFDSTLVVWYATLFFFLCFVITGLYASSTLETHLSYNKATFDAMPWFGKKTNVGDICKYQIAASTREYDTQWTLPLCRYYMWCWYIKCIFFMKPAPSFSQNILQLYWHDKIYHMFYVQTFIQDINDGKRRQVKINLIHSIMLYAYIWFPLSHQNN